VLGEDPSMLVVLMPDSLGIWLDLLAEEYLSYNLEIRQLILQDCTIFELAVIHNSLYQLVSQEMHLLMN
jgi:hypothetical protein